MERTHDKTVTWHLEVLPRATKKALEFFARQKWLQSSAWYLAGGTALALQVGHRESLDLDFFIPEKTFLPADLLKHFEKGEFNTDIVREGTVFGKVMGAKVSFIAYPFFKARLDPLWYGAVRVVPSADIAVMKIIAISQRGRKRDFFDLYWYCMNREPLLDIVSRVSAQYPTVNHNYHHITKSLMYFADAEEDPMPQIFFDATWRAVKQYFQKEVPRITREILELK